MKFFNFFSLFLTIWLTGCAVYTPDPFVPYKTYDYPPPSLSGRVNEPVSLRCIDNSNIFVHCNEAWWWGGPTHGWIPVGGGWYPWPRQIWPEKVYDLYTEYQLKGRSAPVIPFPY